MTSNCRKRLLRPILVLFVAITVIDVACGAKMNYTVPSGGSANLDCTIKSKFSSCCLMGGFSEFNNTGSTHFETTKEQQEMDGIKYGECKLKTTQGFAKLCTNPFGCTIICDTDCMCEGKKSGTRCGNEDIIVEDGDNNDQGNNKNAAEDDTDESGGASVGASSLSSLQQTLFLGAVALLFGTLT